MQLEQQTHFLHSLFFIHPAIQNATPQYSMFHERQPGTTIEQFNGIPRDPVFICKLMDFLLFMYKPWG